MTAIFDKLLAVLRRDALTAVRHRSGFAITMAGVLVELAAFYSLSRAIGPGFPAWRCCRFRLPWRWRSD